MATAVDRAKGNLEWRIEAWIPLVLFPVTVAAWCGDWPPWALMWAIAISIFVGLKWLTLATSTAAHDASWRRIAGYLFLWPGLNADAFLANSEQPVTPSWQEWGWAWAKTAGGLMLLISAVPPAMESYPLIAGWLDMIGLVLVILLASAAVPQVLDWRTALAKLDPLFRQLVWVHGAFIVLVIVGFGMLSTLLSDQLASGTPLARGVCLFIALFWAARLGLQFFVFDAKPHLKNPFLKVGYHGLTVVFLYHAIVFSIAAFCPF